MALLDFTEFAKIAWQLVTDDYRQGEKVRALLRAITHFDSKGEDLVEAAPIDTLSRYYSKPGRIRDFAHRLLPYISADYFKHAADSASTEAKRKVADALLPYDSIINPSNVVDRCGELLEDILTSEAEKTHRRRNKDTESQSEVIKSVENHLAPKQDVMPLEIDHANDTSENYLLEECEWRCPLCNDRLIKRSKDTPLRRYRKVDIIPDDLQSIMRQVCDEEHIPFPVKGSLDNMALLCLDHAEDYAINPSISKCLELLRRKEEMKIRYDLMCSIDELDIDKDIEELLDSLDTLILANADTDSRMNPLDVTQKIEPNNALLKRDIDRYVIDYFLLLKTRISEMTGEQSLNFKKLSASVRMCYEEFAARGFDQYEVYSGMSQWMAKRTGCKHLACQVLIAFFVQMCEVFDEITE